jgi:uncharacterized protein (TIGR01244 family)
MADLVAVDEKTFLSGQIQPEDLDEIAAEGIRLIVVNRPDGESPYGQPTAKELEAEAARYGIAVLNLPFTAPTLTPEHVAIFAEALSQADGKILAFCRSGNRSSMLWAAANVALGAPIDAVIQQAADAGFDLKPAASFIRDLGNSAVIE